MHAEVHVLLLVDPLEIAPPHCALPFRSGDAQVRLDLASEAQRRRWAEAFTAPADAALVQLAARGIHARLLSSEAPSDAWLDQLHPAGRAA
jgi:hypothetical protein